VRGEDLLGTDVWPSYGEIASSKGGAMRRLSRLAVLLAVMAAVAVGCGDDSEELNVALSEFAVQPEEDTVDAGDVELVADNKGAETHELVVVRAASADELPVDDNGAFDEDAFGEEKLLGEVEDVASRSDKSITLDLDAGTYVLLCNVVEEAEDSGEVESHFANGMHAVLTVE
jgi:hypothetical protein